MALKKAPAHTQSPRPSPRRRQRRPSRARTRLVTLKHLAASLSESHETAQKSSATRCSADMVDLVTRHLKKGDKHLLNGLGMFQVRKRAARMGCNPATGEAIKIKASKKVAFRVAKELKEAV